MVGLLARFARLVGLRPPGLSIYQRPTGLEAPVDLYCSNMAIATSSSNLASPFEAIKVITPQAEGRPRAGEPGEPGVPPGFPAPDRVNRKDSLCLLQMTLMGSGGCPTFRKDPLR